jgi:hypothetical protein
MWKRRLMLLKRQSLLCAMMKKQRPVVVTKEIYLPSGRAPITVLMYE